MKSNERRYLVMLYRPQVGVIGFDNIFAMDEVQAVKKAMNEAFKMFPNAKFGLHGYSVTDGDTTITTERNIRFIGKI